MATAPDPRPPASDLLAMLTQHRSLGAAPVAELEWLVKHGTRQTLPVGAIFTHKGELVTALAVFLSGHVVIRVDRGAGAHKIFEWHGGDVGGALPFSRGARPPNDAIAEEETDVLLVPREDLDEMIRDCPKITAVMVHQMLDRARQFNAADMRDEKLVSLGRLAAGMAHELNNPASAAVRSAKLMADGFNAAEEAATAMVAARLSDVQLAAINGVRQAYTEETPIPHLSALARADREEEIADWLAEHGLDEELAGPIAEAGITTARLDTVAEHITGDALVASLKWISAGCLMRALAWELETAASRIYDLVNSVKGFTYMDHAPTAEPVDIRRGINDTLTMLAGKIRAKNANVTVDLAGDARAHGIGAELNQVWMNLIDNALGAVSDGGRIQITSAAERGRVVVRITDNGAGIPADIVGRIFDPFFTTKPVGSGTGMGLDIVRRILKRHEGEIEVESAPGRTQFCVTLPAAK